MTLMDFCRSILLSLWQAVAPPTTEQLLTELRQETPAPPAEAPATRVGLFHVILHRHVQWVGVTGFTMNAPLRIRCVVCGHVHLVPLFRRQKHFCEASERRSSVVYSCEECAGSVQSSVHKASP